MGWNTKWRGAAPDGAWDYITVLHARGRRLFIVTTNYDAGRRVVWNMGAIAAKGDDNAIKLFRDVLLASSAIPGIFSPVGIKVAANGKQFEDGTVDQCMEFDSVQEWMIINKTSVPHPFHIHVNPFQIVEYFDPTKPQTKLDGPYVWQDTIEIPAHDNTSNKDGYVKMRSRFCDFDGKFVLHCHILGHEDRGMMQIVEVKRGTCPATPYKTALTHGH